MPSRVGFMVARAYKSPWQPPGLLPHIHIYVHARAGNYLTAAKNFIGDIYERIIFDSSPLQCGGKEEIAGVGCAIRAIAIAITLDPHAIKLSPSRLRRLFHAPWRAPADLKRWAWKIGWKDHRVGERIKISASVAAAFSVFVPQRYWENQSTDIVASCTFLEKNK